MTAARSGDTVRIRYTGTLANGVEFDTTEGRDPMEFELGGGEVIRGFEEAVVGMAPGDRKTFTLEPDKGYGERVDEIVQTVPRSALPADIELAEGLVLEATQPGGQGFNLRVASFDDESVTLDANHPLAGETLTFKVELVEIV